MVGLHHRALITAQAGGGGGGGAPSPVLAAMTDTIDTSGATTNLTLPTADVGDLRIINFQHYRFSGVTTAPATPSGWTILKSTGFLSNGTRQAWHQVYGRIKVGGDSDVVAIPGSANNFGVASGIRVTGATTVTPDVVSHAQTNLSAVGLTGASVTTTGPGRLLLALWGMVDVGAPTGPGADWTLFKNSKGLYNDRTVADQRDAATAGTYTGPTRTAQQLATATIFSCTTLAVY